MTHEMLFSHLMHLCDSLTAPCFAGLEYCSNCASLDTDCFLFEKGFLKVQSLWATPVHCNSGLMPADHSVPLCGLHCDDEAAKDYKQPIFAAS